jgi:hypothetical protein
VKRALLSLFLALRLTSGASGITYRGLPIMSLVITIGLVFVTVASAMILLALKSATLEAVIVWGASLCALMLGFALFVLLVSLIEGLRKSGN